MAGLRIHFTYVNNGNIFAGHFELHELGPSVRPSNEALMRIEHAITETVQADVIVHDWGVASDVERTAIFITNRKRIPV
ncbi:hypothetical protein EVB78_085 [Rhizobium phage RHph_N1_15]|nr:hypothetical protein EVB77_084 [Rhizobium phage RHph_N1_10]QIG69287.1 hypothetical protein EVB78_085 [Rhizobium phage RHph_N1_15]QIG75147.1 hypothetical protein EVC15_085 [Rhizobium phage RHph_N2_6]